MADAKGGLFGIDWSQEQPTTEATAEAARLREQAAELERDANSEWPGSYYRKAFRAKARRLRAKASRIAAGGSR